ncbi:chaperone ATPase hsp78 [Elasticomyces elasticus]|nr:chaperone ATPase hsp78 [Elasticomyces elasticus]
MPFKTPLKRVRTRSVTSSSSHRNVRPIAATSSSRHSSISTSAAVPTVSDERQGHPSPSSHRSTPTLSDATPSQRATSPQREDGDADLDALNEIIMGVDLRDRGTVGCSYYVAREEKLYFMEDVKLGGVEVIDTLKLFIDPTVILVSTRVDDEVINHLDPETRNRSPAENRSMYVGYVSKACADLGAGDQFRLPYLLEVRPSSEFAYTAAKTRLVNLNIGSDEGPSVTFVVPGDILAGEEGHLNSERGLAGRQARQLRLAGWIDIDSRLTVGCAGAVLTYLQRRRAAGFLPGDEHANQLFRISTVEMFSLSGSMQVCKNLLHTTDIN